MKLHELKPAKGSVHKEKRIGRGEGSGYGGTSTKGNKGGQSRAGYKRKMGHEGGQMPIQRRTPKRGFKNPDKIVYKVINIGQIDQWAETHNITDFSEENLYHLGFIGKTDRVKVLGNGEIKGKFNFKVHAISEKAKAAIEAAGGTVEILK
ncbi:50S ribosomal protein L15 [Niabella ginsenosidivorans]|uniref:Large ribosomal subunit protein uL15 n=1 Tax=Niabella ginsenosidivorans TaxID=1176587 RepID=A0A1A9I1J7_9BACT|nr:50S ribosomal protein L15 [Niabella ginsenosidivorans]ANH80434.1 50S ribosomal protein L15 [Niabella ginsenosidivorans]